MRNKKGQFVKGNKSFWLGKKMSDETKKKISEAQKGDKNHNYGKHLSEKIKKKLSEIHKKLGTRPPSNLGKHHSEETKRKISKGNKGKIISDKAREKMSKAHKGKPSQLKGKKLSEEHKKKLRKLHQKFSEEYKKELSRIRRGENSPNWQGGKTPEPYSTDWTETLRRSIRERDHYICQLCGKPQGDRALSVHHIDYNKQNCNPDNLITLCIKCHLKTNKNRGYWIEYFNHRFYK